MATIKRYVGNFRKPLRWKGVKHFLRYVLLPALTAVLVMCIVRAWFVTHIALSVDAPQCGLLAGDRLLINRVAYGFYTPFPSLWGNHCWGRTKPERGDIVAFCPADGSEQVIVARIEGIPGDTVRVSRRGILPPETYLAGNSLIVHSQIIGRVSCVTYSIAPEAPFYRCLRGSRFFSKPSLP